MASLIEERVAAARRGQNPTVIARVHSGWVVLGDYQHLPGYCVLLADPVVPSLNDLADSDRGRFLLDMAAVGDVLGRRPGVFRINYSILGNLDPVLHAHIFPRYDDEDSDLRQGPVWLYPAEARQATPFDAVRDADLMSWIRSGLATRGVVVPHSSP